jgi:hypothetical protein
MLRAPFFSKYCTCLRWLLWDAEWNIGIIGEPIHVFLERGAKPVYWLPSPGKDRFIADPFAIIKNERIYVFCEEYDHRVNKGRIVCIEIHKGRIDAEIPVIDHPFVHMSYPYLVEENGETYCVPETAQAREISLYRAKSFPDEWEKATTLVSNFAGVDNTVFRYKDCWWLMSAIAHGSSQYSLFIWHAKGLFGPWIRHGVNPVRLDASSRPGGTPFIHDDRLYRPAQDCSRDRHRIVINRINQLTPSEFEEEPIALVEPDPKGPYPDGLHTLAAYGNMTFVDGNRFRFIGTATTLQEVKIRLINRANDLRRKVAKR